MADALRGMLQTKSAATVVPDGVGSAFGVGGVPSPPGGP